MDTLAYRLKLLRDRAELVSHDLLRAQTRLTELDNDLRRLIADNAELVKEVKA